ncbi:hypothetical protein A7P61_11305 [Pantoea agglomerans pv. betae]|uniref:hypothetical protein n=1 Tax=Enterobacter agglomerans TaxID=549 RepID=UPI0012DAC2F9|nr:hypothetical protein [Pantoea agglomerans]WHU85528.1 hypothetical protein A7P61_11305 [Pantoea agglomerans pv. betae]
MLLDTPLIQLPGDCPNLTTITLLTLNTDSLFGHKGAESIFFISDFTSSKEAGIIFAIAVAFIRAEIRAELPASQLRKELPNMSWFKGLSTESMFSAP